MSLPNMLTYCHFHFWARREMNIPKEHNHTTYSLIFLNFLSPKVLRRSKTNKNGDRNLFRFSLCFNTLKVQFNL